jgi:hypothetical protein
VASRSLARRLGRPSLPAARRRCFRLLLLRLTAAELATVRWVPLAPAFLPRSGAAPRVAAARLVRGRYDLELPADGAVCAAALD